MGHHVTVNIALRMLSTIYARFMKLFGFLDRDGFGCSAMMVTKMLYIYFGTVMVLLPWRQATRDGE